MCGSITAAAGCREQSKPAGTFSAARDLSETDVFDGWRGVWRTGVVYDLFGNGQTALKASASRYAGQIGLNMVQRVHPFQFTSGTRPWTDDNTIGFRRKASSARSADSPGRRAGIRMRTVRTGLYSDEFTAGVEHQLARDIRVGAMYCYRTNRKLIGSRNVAAPLDAYTTHTIAVPGAPAGPGGTIDFYNLLPAFNGLQDNVFDNYDVLDTDYQGVEFTASKRMSDRWQLLAGLTFGRERRGRADGRSERSEQPAQLPAGDRRHGFRYTYRVSGSYMAPVRDQRQRQLHRQRRLPVPVDLRRDANGVPDADAIVAERAAEPNGATNGSPTSR